MSYRGKDKLKASLGEIALWKSAFALVLVALVIVIWLASALLS